MSKDFIRVPSGILGLDENIEGGFEKNSAVLLAGGGGSGKTICATQFLLAGISKFNHTGIYISFEERKEKFYLHMKRFGWDLAELEKQGRFIFIKYSPEEMLDIVKNKDRVIEDAIRQVNAKRIVIDSITAYGALFENQNDQRKMLVSLFEMIADWDCTTLLVHEEDQYPEKHVSSVMGFMADAIIKLYNIRKGNKMVRAVEVFKMRGTNHSTNINPMEITEQGVKLVPNIM
jgi:circadian clock protein KaiC